jgi:ABC-type glutathione transport system ATPase component
MSGTPGNTVSFTSHTLIIRNLTYTIPINHEPIDSKQNVSFWALPRSMASFTGFSGVGKTTLVNVVAGPKTVRQARGSFMVDDGAFTKYATPPPNCV